MEGGSVEDVMYMRTLPLGIRGTDGDFDKVLKTSAQDQKIHLFSFGGLSYQIPYQQGLASHMLALALAYFEHLKASANSGILETVPSVRYRGGE